MKIGFYTSTFNDRPAEEVLDFAAAASLPTFNHIVKFILFSSHFESYTPVLQR